MRSRTRIILLLCGLSVFTYLVFDYGIDNIVENVRKTGWWFIPTVAVWLIVYLCNAGAWFVILRAYTNGLRFSQIFGVTLTSFAINYVTPFLNLGGEPYRALAMREVVGTHRAVSSVILYNMIRWLAHFLFWLASILLAVFVFEMTPAIAVPLAGIALFLLLLTLFFLNRHRKGILEALLNKLQNVRLLHFIYVRMEKHRASLVMIDEQIRQLYNEQRGTFNKAVGLEFLSRVVGSLEFYCILYALGFKFTVLDAVFINAATSLVLNILFFIPFELGTREGSLYVIMEMLGFASGVGIFVGLVNRVRELFWILIGFLVMMFSGGHRTKVSMMEMMEAKELS